MLHDHREQLIEKMRKNKLFLQLMGKYTISDTTRLYPRPTFTQDLCSSHLPDVGNHVLYGSMLFVVGDDTIDALKALK